MPLDWQKTRYILPNLFTLASVLSGMFSMHLSQRATSTTEMALAAWLIVVSMLCDACDGRVARMTHTESAFGVQLDSLADAVSFGVAPAWLLFHWGLTPLGPAGVVIAFCYAAATLVRLARFNVAASEDNGCSRYFQGLPSPLAAGGVVALVLAAIAQTEQHTTPAYGAVALAALLLGGLMVSSVRYRTFKDVRLRGRAGLIVMGLIAALALIGLLFKPSTALVVAMMLYIVIGLGGGLIDLTRHIFGHEDEPSELAQELLAELEAERLDGEHRADEDRPR